MHLGADFDNPVRLCHDVFHQHILPDSCFQIAKTQSTPARAARCADGSAGPGIKPVQGSSRSRLVILALALAGQSAAAWARQRLQHVEKERMAGFRYWLH